MRQEEHEAHCQEILGQPWPEVHEFLDQFFQRYRSYSHRIILHHQAGIAHLRQRLGEAARAAAELHVKDDMGFIPRSPFYFFADPEFQPNILECMKLEKDCARFRIPIPFSVIYSLPAEYRGYPSADLMKMFGRMDREKKMDEPEEKILAMGALLREYRIAPVYWQH